MPIMRMLQHYCCTGIVYRILRLDRSYAVRSRSGGAYIIIKVGRNNIIYVLQRKTAYNNIMALHSRVHPSSPHRSRTRRMPVFARMGKTVAAATWIVCVVTLGR